MNNDDDVAREAAGRFDWRPFRAVAFIVCATTYGDLNDADNPLWLALMLGAPFLGISAWLLLGLTVRATQDKAD